ncbi:MAG: DUF302 domain-containing protein [Acidobacteriota bacterium]
MRSKARTMLLAGFLGVLAASAGFATTVEPAAPGRRVTVKSSKSFEQVTDAITSMVARNGMMVMAQVDQGKMLSMTGLHLKAKLFLIGNPTIGKKLFAQDRAVGLYVPLRVYVYEAGDGRTYISYDRPSALLGESQDADVLKIAGMLDRKLQGLTTMAAR